MSPGCERVDIRRASGGVVWLDGRACGTALAVIVGEPAQEQ